MAKPRKKRRQPKPVLALPHAINDFVEWYCSEPRASLIASIWLALVPSLLVNSIRSRSLSGKGISEAESWQSRGIGDRDATRISIVLSAGSRRSSAKRREACRPCV